MAIDEVTGDSENVRRSGLEQTASSAKREVDENGENDMYDTKKGYNGNYKKEEKEEYFIPKAPELSSIGETPEAYKLPEVDEEEEEEIEEEEKEDEGKEEEE
jgi:hypothetical protein